MSELEEIEKEIARRKELAEIESEIAKRSNSPAMDLYNQSQSGLFTGARDFIGSMAVDSAAFPASGVYGLTSLGDPQEASDKVSQVQGMNPGVQTEFGQVLQEAAGQLMQKGVDIGNTVLGAAASAWQGNPMPSEQINNDGFIRYTEDALLNAGVPPSVVATIKGTMAAGLFNKGVKSQIGDVPKSKELMKQKLADGSTDTDTALYRLEQDDWRNPNTVKSERPFELEDMRLSKDPNAKNLIKQGFDKEMIPPVREASNIDIRRMKEMTNIAESMTGNAITKITRSPLDVVGNSLLDRYKFIRKQMIDSGKRVGQEARNLKGKPVDFAPAIDNFAESLKSMGIKISDEGDWKLDYSESILSGNLLKSTRKAIDDVVKQMKSPKGTPDAYQVHSFKKALDEILEWGSNKGKDGFAGKTERIIKSLRRDMDQVLDGKFSAYDKANTDFATLRNAMDQFEDILGKKIDVDNPIANKQVGLQLRKLGSNYASKYPIFNAVNVIDDVANQFKGNFKDNLLTQVMFANKLNKRFKLDGDNTFKALTTQAEMDAFSRAGMVRKGYESVREVYRNDQEAFKALNKYLDELEGKK